MAKKQTTKNYVAQSHPRFIDKNIQIPYYNHLTADIITDHHIEDPEEVKKLLFAAARKAKNTPIKAIVHKFSPHGITGVILLAESHIAIHSWPELNYVAIDVFTCGKKTQPRKALEYFRKKYKAKIIKIQEIREG